MCTNSSLNRVVIVGAAGKPIGGISSFVKSFSEELSFDNDVWIVDPYPVRDKYPLTEKHIILKNVLPFSVFEMVNTLKRLNPDVVYLNFSKIKSILALPFLKFIKARKYLSLHHGELCVGFTCNSFVLKYLYRFCMDCVNQVIPLSHKQFVFYNSFLSSKKISPVCNVFVAGVKCLNKPNDDVVSEFLSQSKIFDRVFLISGYDKSYYNHELVEDFLSSLTEKKICLVKVIYGGSDAEQSYYYLNQSLTVVCVHSKPQEEFNWILSRVDVYVRPTLIDSLGLAAWQAAYLRKIVIATNVCERPFGSYLYDPNSSDQLCKLLSDAVKSMLSTAISDPVKNLEKFQSVLGLKSG